MPQRKYSLLPAAASFILFSGLKFIILLFVLTPACHADPYAEVSPVEGVAGRPCLCVVRISNDGISDLALADASSVCAWARVLSYPSAVPALGEGNALVLLTPDKPGALSGEVAFSILGSPGSRLTCRIGGWVAESSSVPSGTAGLMWLRDAAAAAGTVRVTYPDAGLYCTPADILSCRLLVVDLRSEEEHLSSRVPGAVRVDPFALVSRPFLRGRDVALVDSGAGGPDTEGLCRSLAKAGAASVRILEGGVMGWTEEGLRAEGKEPGGVRSLPPETLRDVLGSGIWRTVYVGTNTSTAAAILPGCVWVPRTSAEDPQGWVGEESVSIVPDEARVLVVDDGDIPIADLLVFRKASGRPVYSLQGGLDGYLGRLKTLVRSKSPGRASTVYVPALAGGSGSLVSPNGKGGCGCGG